jgi:hypothetical protein
MRNKLDWIELTIWTAACVAAGYLADHTATVLIMLAWAGGNAVLSIFTRRLGGMAPTRAVAACVFTVLVLRSLDIYGYWFNVVYWAVASVAFALMLYAFGWLRVWVLRDPWWSINVSLTLPRSWF